MFNMIFTSYQMYNEKFFQFILEKKKKMFRLFWNTYIYNTHNGDISD